ncbi:hypothetical protein N9W34_04875 [Rickettsiales bacterium]|nr:hypothetical protein [Rickettsiales bacterium]
MALTSSDVVNAGITSTFVLSNCPAAPNSVAGGYTHDMPAITAAPTRGQPTDVQANSFQANSFQANSFQPSWGGGRG